jgi:hypothetical protein
MSYPKLAIAGGVDRCRRRLWSRRDEIAVRLNRLMPKIAARTALAAIGRFELPINAPWKLRPHVNAFSRSRAIKIQKTVLPRPYPRQLRFFTLLRTAADVL